MMMNRDEKGKCQRFEECFDSTDNMQCNQCIISADTRSKIICRDGHAKYTLVNDVDPKEFVKNYKIDGGVITGDGRKCDGMFYIPNLNKVVLIELKSGQYEHAVTQLLRTYETLKETLRGKQVYSRIVSSSVPNIKVASPATTRLKKVTKQYGGTHKDLSLSGACEEKISQLDNT